VLCENIYANQEEDISVKTTSPVRLVQAWDEDEIADLYRAGGWWKEEYRVEEIRHLIHGSFLFAVSTDEKTGRAVGMGRVLSDGVSDGYIQDLVVLPEYRKKGLGSQIVSELVKKCREKGLTWIGIIAEPDSSVFYSLLGFQKMENYVPMIYRGEL
jgi:ribosomal protein S18 acetylase RimI-like enzyme